MTRYACVDVGSTSVKLGIYDGSLERIHSEAVTVPLSADGLHNPEAVYSTVRQMIRKGKELGVTSVGLATYRASVVAWKKDGTPLSPVITWLNTDSRLTYQKLPFHVKAVAKVPPFDLIISPYSPLVRFRRLLETNPKVGEMLRAGEAMAWTLESYLVYRLTGRYVSDATSATLTGLVHPKSLKTIGVAKSLMGLDLPIPEVVENAGELGEAESIPLTALIADQQAACLSEDVVSGSAAKVTNGTGTFVDLPVEGYTSKRGLVPIVIAKVGGSVYHGLEGYLPSTGRALDLLMSLGLLSDYSSIESLQPAPGVKLVPALAGLQIPRVPEAKGVIYGLTADTSREAVVSSLLDSVAFHVRLVLETSGTRATSIRANGNLSRSTELLRRISALTGLSVERQKDVEGSMRGLAILQAIWQGALKVAEIGTTRKGIEVINEGGKHRRDGDYRNWTTLAKSLRNFRT